MTNNLKLGQRHETTREIVLSEDELEEKKRDFAQLYTHREKAVVEAKEAAKRNRVRIAAMANNLEAMANAINTGKEERAMLVYWRALEDDPGIAELVEEKTGRVLERRPLELHERQMDIYDFVPPVARDDGAGPAEPAFREAFDEQGEPLPPEEVSTTVARLGQAMGLNKGT